MYREIKAGDFLAIPLQSNGTTRQSRINISVESIEMRCAVYYCHCDQNEWANHQSNRKEVEEKIELVVINASFQCNRI